MPRLNLITDLKFYNDEDGFYQYDKIVEDCELPFRESFRTREILQQGWDFKDHSYGMKVGSVVIWKFVDFILENNIGKNYDNAFSYYTKKTKKVWGARYSWDRNFEGRYFEYIKDEYGNIQKNMDVRTGWWTRNKKIKLSKTEKRLNLERLQKEKQNRRIQAAIPTIYCYTTKKEKVEKIDKEVELQRLRKRGFDENSFRGEEYHGRKNKKK